MASIAEIIRRLIPPAVDAYLTPPKPKRPVDRWLRLRRLWLRLFPVRELKPEAEQRHDRPFIVRALFPRKLTDAETREIKAERERLDGQKKMEFVIAKEAREYRRIISQTLLNKGLVHETSNEKRKTISQIEFSDPPNINEEIIEWRIDTKRLPRGIDLQMLRDEALLDVMAANIGHRVRFRFKVGFGAWYVIDRQEDAGGVPAHVRLIDMDGESRPAYLANDRLAIPFGLGEGRKPLWRSLPDLVHVLVAGAPGHGKSTLLNLIICVLASQNTPEQLRMVLVDLKGGMEFFQYWSLPHLLSLPRITLKKKPKAKASADDDDDDDGDAPPNPDEPIAEDVPETTDRYREEFVIKGENNTPSLRVVQDAADLPGVLYWLIRESERRMKLFKDAGVRKLSEYNQYHQNNRLPVIVLVIDEWADVKLTRGVGALAEEMLVNLSNRARALGIHCIVCTQTPNSETLTQRIRAALVTRIVFRIVDPYMSIALVNSQRAHEITRKGRAFFINGAFHDEIQVPLITNEMVTEMVAAATAHKPADLTKRRAHDVSDEEILEWAVRENDGRLGANDIYQRFKERKLPRAYAQDFGPRLVNQRFSIAGTWYKLHEGRSGFPVLPYRLLSEPVEPAPVNLLEAHEQTA